MIIRQHQLEVYDTILWKERIDKISNYLIKTYPEANLQNDSEFKSWVRHRMMEAERYEILDEPELIEFIDLHFHHLELNDNPKNQWIVSLLTHPGRSSENKIKMLIERLNFR